MQRQGIGHQLLDKAAKQARLWPADAIRLDAFDADAGAGSFYARCGFGRVTYGKAPLIYFERILWRDEMKTSLPGNVAMPADKRRGVGPHGNPFHSGKIAGRWQLPRICD
jgi:predicted N-acetyltransferase YhbS